MKKAPIYIALDLESGESALSLARLTAPYVEGFKVGPGLYFKAGPSLVSKLKAYGKVFLDFKFFDIPSTMLLAVERAFDGGADMVTVHAQAGVKSLALLAGLEARLRAGRDFRILAVTVLTSFLREDLPPLARGHSVFSQVESLADMVIKSGLSGLVCAGSEAGHLRKRHPGAYLLVPGIRFSSPQTKATIAERGRVENSSRVAGEKSSSKTTIEDKSRVAIPPAVRGRVAIPPAWREQKRVFTPVAAMEAGANALVIGRPIYESADPARVCAQLQAELMG